MEKEFNVSIRPKKTYEASEVSKYLSDNYMSMEIKEVLLKSHLKKILADYLNVELKTSEYVNMITDVGGFIEELCLPVFIESINETKINVLSKIVSNAVYFINSKYNLFSNLSDLEPYINDSLLLLI